MLGEAKYIEKWKDPKKEKEIEKGMHKLRKRSCNKGGRASGNVAIPMRVRDWILSTYLEIKV